MIERLFEAIESDDIATKVYLANTTEWLYRWIGRIPEVVELEKFARNDPHATSRLVSRTLALFDAPIKHGYRSEHEPALCCYAYVLYQLDSVEANRALTVLDQTANYAYGWLRQILDRSLRNASTVDRVNESFADYNNQILLFGSLVRSSAEEPEANAFGAFDDYSEA